MDKEGFTKNISGRVSPEQKKKYELVGGINFLRKILDEIDPESMKLDVKNNAVKPNNTVNPNKGLITKLSKLRTNILQIITKIVILRIEDPTIEILVEEGNLLAKKITEEIDRLEFNPLEIKEIEVRLNRLKPLGEKINTSAKIINSKNLVEDDMFTTKDREKVTRNFNMCDRFLNEF